MDGHFPSCIDPETCWCEARRLAHVLGIAVAILVVQLVGAYWSNSLALYADTVHVFLDNLAIVITLAVAVLVRRGYPADLTRKVGFCLNVALLVVLPVWIFIHACLRFGAPQPIIGPVMIVASVLGGIGNWIQLRILERLPGTAEHGIHRALSLHLLSDLMQSVAVIAGGIVIALTKWWVVDSLLSMAIALWILRQTLGLVLGRR